MNWLWQIWTANSIKAPIDPYVHDRYAACDKIRQNQRQCLRSWSVSCNKIVVISTTYELNMTTRTSCAHPQPHHTTLKHRLIRMTEKQVKTIYFRVFSPTFSILFFFSRTRAEIIQQQSEKRNIDRKRISAFDHKLPLIDYYDRLKRISMTWISMS